MHKSSAFSKENKSFGATETMLTAELSLWERSDLEDQARAQSEETLWDTNTAVYAPHTFRPTHAPAAPKEPKSNRPQIQVHEV